MAHLAPLRDVRVLDASIYLPGPYLTRILADLGADVVRVESPAGDPARLLPPLVDGLGAGYRALNVGKDSLVVDLKTEDGVYAFLDMAERSQVVVESFRPGVLDRLGVGFDSLRKRNPKVILCSISGYGQEGPLRGRAGHDLNYMALAGALGMFGPADGVPSVPGIQVADLAGGALFGAVSVLAALLELEKGGGGRHLDISMARGAHALLNFEIARRMAGDPEPRGQGLLTGGVPCYRTYKTLDGGVMALGALEPKFFQAFCRAAGLKQLSGEGLARGADGRRVMDELERVFASKSLVDWVELLKDVDCCCEPVLSPEDAHRADSLGADWVDTGGAVALRTPLGAELGPLRPVEPGNVDQVVERWSLSESTARTLARR